MELGSEPGEFTTLPVAVVEYFTPFQALYSLRATGRTVSGTYGKGRMEQERQDQAETQTPQTGASFQLSCFPPNR